MPKNYNNRLSWFGLRTLRQRYLSATILVSIALLFSAYFGWRYVDLSSHQQLQHINHRTDASDALSNVILQKHTLESSLQRYITLPTTDNQQNIYRSFKLFGIAIEKLSLNQWIIDDPVLSDLVVSLSEDREKLINVTNELITIRSDETKWFPALDIMQQRMLNHNLNFMSALNNLILESSENLDNKTQQKIYILTNKIRHTWQMMISEFRLYVSNSFGVFSNNPAKGMLARKKNIEIYLTQLNRLLKKFDTLDQQGALDIISKDSLQELRHWSLEWQSAYTDVRQSLSSKQWRRDLEILRDDITPVLARIQQRSSSLQLELGVASAKNITDLTVLARELSDFVIIVAIGLSLLALVGYFVFHHAILKPIENFSLALHSTASGEHIDRAKLMTSSAEEFQSLAKSYTNMHEQIQIRQSNLDHMAHHDALTQLPNRILLRDRLELAIARARRDKTIIGLMFLDLDHFKQINDSLGHDIGDQLLVMVSRRLRDCVRSTDTVSRLGGDEFAIVVEGVTHVDQIASMARKVINSFVAPFQLEKHELHSSTSIGIALGPSDDNDVDALIKDADIAMYHAKDLGRNNYKFYSVEMAKQVAEHMALENKLRNAFEQNEFFLLYQPIIDINSGKIISTEALIRWQHPERGIIGPKEFIRSLEDSGLIRPVTQWVLNTASLQYMEFKKAGYRNIRMSVNLSGVLLKGDSILDIVVNAIEKTKVDPSGLIMEITEDTLLEDFQGAEKSLSILKDMGIRIALDDFGTGQSSLSHLRLNPIDIVKIDRSFIRDVPADNNDSDLVDAVIAMAHKLRMKVVAEGVENKDQLEFLRWHKCDAIQGYFFSEPCSGRDILKLLEEKNNTSADNRKIE